ncbi:hypothetical protein RhiirB3_134592 [Rhizophagus irregularis]|nr:hypothetical protein RhiirB3_134592 [Rhizophagus irregularis]
MSAGFSGEESFRGCLESSSSFATLTLSSTFSASRLTFSTSCLVFFGNSIYSSSLASSYLALNSTFSAISLAFSFLINNKVSNS